MRLPYIQLLGERELHPQRFRQSLALLEPGPRNVGAADDWQNDRGDVFRWPAIDQVLRQSVLVFILEKVDRRVGRDGRDGMLVHQLRRASFAFEQYAEII